MSWSWTAAVYWSGDRSFMPLAAGPATPRHLKTLPESANHPVAGGFPTPFPQLLRAALPVTGAIRRSQDRPEGDRIANNH